MPTREVFTPETLVRAASSDAVVGQAILAGDRIRHWKRWLNTRHPYNGNVVRGLSGRSNVDGPRMAEYIAFSAPLHLTDGWNYLSRAFESVIRGDRNTAYHLAYYAELRGAISLLAAEGIGVFNTRHIAIDDSLEPVEFRLVRTPPRGGGRPQRRPAGTHRATWLLLSAWARQSGSADRLLKSITIESASLLDWLVAIGVFEPSRRLIARRWLNAWSVDLRALSTDTGRRNEISYRPSRMRSPQNAPVDPQNEMATPTLDYWNELDPNLAGTRAALDLSLLRQALLLVINEGLCSFDNLNDALRALKNELSDTAYAQLSAGRTSALSVFDAASLTNIRETATTPILARSLLILRLAAARCSALLSAAGLTKSDLEFWWSPLGSDLGFWEDPDDYQTLSDLWWDVEDAVDRATNLLSLNQEPATVRSYSRILCGDVALTQFSRASLWLLGLD